MEPNYSVVFKFEKEYDRPAFDQWMQKNWTSAYVYSALYIMVIFGGRYYMHHRPKYDLRPALALWSGVLAIFSIFGTVRMWPELLHSVQNHSLQYSVCNPSFLQNEVTAFWCFLFTVSKVFELGDTVFIVLRKQNLIFLHWYHHITVLLYSWYSYLQHTASGRWFMTINYTVHAFMYSYYALRAMRFVIPKWVNITITLMQLIQMVIGSIIQVWVYQIKSRGEHCNQEWDNLIYGFVMYFTYFVLFAHFFYNAYLKPKEAVTHKKHT